MSEEGITEKEFRHSLIQKEFREILTSPEKIVSPETQGVVVLSGAYLIKENGELEVAIPENILRIEFGIEIVKQIVAQKSGKGVSQITREDILQYAPPLILNWETELLPKAKELVVRMGFPEERIEFLDCGKMGEANTKTQFQAINSDHRYQTAKHLTFITSDYHVPRTVRTAVANLASKIDFEVLPTPHLKRASYNVFRKVRGEVRRIQTYSKKGDISRTLK